MSRYIGPKCKLCRREGVKLFLKGSRCDSLKCAIAKRPHPPGEHPWARKRRSEYGLQLREKQKAKRTYGLFDKPFRRMFAEAERMKGNTGENLVQLMERRLDNVVYLAGFAVSRPQARQLLVHGHFTVNGRRVRSPGIRMRVADALGIVDREKTKELIKLTSDQTKGRETPAWIEVDRNGFEARIAALPKRDDATMDIQEQLIVEFCSK